jgi:hypothetical protein
MIKLTVAFRNLTHLTRSHFWSIFSQTQKVSITQVGNLVETGQLEVAVNRADGKQRNRMFAIFFESRIMENELNREKQVTWRGKTPYIASALMFSTLLLLCLLSPVCTIFTIIYLKQTLFIRYTVLQLLCIYSLCYM